MNAQRPDFSRVTSEELSSSLSSLVSNERRALVDFIWRLDELDQRDGLGDYKSLFDYCNRKLRLSNGCSYLRWRSVLLFRKFPVIAEYLADGRVSFRKAVLLQDVFTTENVVALLDQASALSEYRVKKLVATAIPQPAVPDKRRPLRSPTSPGEVNRPAPTAEVRATSSGEVIRPAATAKPGSTSPGEVIPFAAIHTAPSFSSTPALVAGFAGPDERPRAAQECSTSANDGLPTPLDFGMQLFTSRPEKRRKDLRKPLNATDTEFGFTCDDEFLALFDQAKSLLSHKFPRGGHAEVLGECLRLAVDVILKKKLGTEKQRPARATKSAKQASRSNTVAAGAPETTVTSPSQVTTSTSPDQAARLTSPGEVTTSTSPEATTSARLSAPATFTSPGEVTSSIEPSVPHYASPTVTSSTFTSPGEVADGRFNDFADPLVPPELFDLPSRYIPKPLRRRICERDGGCCSIVMDDGTRCGSTWQLEVDHRHPFSLGGPAIEENLRLVCGPHNRMLAERLFGSRRRSS